MSRCITRCSCMCATALRSWLKMDHTSRSLSGAFTAARSLSSAARSPQSQKSSTMTSSLFSTNAAACLMTLGWSMLCNKRTSLRQSCLCFASRIS